MPHSTVKGKCQKMNTGKILRTLRGALASRKGKGLSFARIRAAAAAQRKRTE